VWCDDDDDDDDDVRVLVVSHKDFGSVKGKNPRLIPDWARGWRACVISSIFGQDIHFVRAQGA
jgi:hypothetical protein